jgi:hypothetical protein
MTSCGERYKLDGIEPTHYVFCATSPNIMEKGRTHEGTQRCKEAATCDARNNEGEDTEGYEMQHAELRPLKAKGSGRV